MEVLDTVRYLLKNYPHKNELSKGRLNKLVYLADWKSSIDNGVQITKIKWKFNHYGPYVNEIQEKIDIDTRINIKIEQNYYGNDKHLIVLDDDSNFNEPTENEKNTLDFIINITQRLNWDEFINAVYSTYPIKTSERGTYIDLVNLSKEYNKQKEK